MRLATLDLGDPKRPPLVYLHGFPDHPPSARPFLEILAKDRRVIAPWLRGYSPSPIGGPYDLESLAGDVIEVIGDRRVELVGHDWGAAITYAVCAMAPDRIVRATTLALPHIRTFLRRLRDPKQLKLSWYAALFQVPGAGHIAPRVIDRLWRDWSPRVTPSDELLACLRASMPGPIEYYRAAKRSFGPAGKIATPILQLHGADDRCVLPPGEDDAFRFVDRRYMVIPNVGHFLHLEEPALIAKLHSATR